MKIINKISTCIAAASIFALFGLLLSGAKDPATKAFTESIRGTARSIEMIPVAAVSGAGSIWMSKTEIPWEVLDTRAIENRIARTIHLHLRHGKRIANNVLRKSLYILTLIRRDAPTLMDLKSRVHSTAQHARSPAIARIAPSTEFVRNRA